MNSRIEPESSTTYLTPYGVGLFFLEDFNGWGLGHENPLALVKCDRSFPTSFIGNPGLLFASDGSPITTVGDDGVGMYRGGGVGMEPSYNMTGCQMMGFRNIRK